MNCKKHVFFILIIASSYVLADDAGPPPQPPVTSTTAGPITSTTTKPPTEPTTPTTKPTTPTPPTTKPTDPTPPPTTPTTPTPPPTTPTTPTPSPTKPTTPTPPPTTTARPQPPSDWVVHGPNNTVCIIAKMDMKLTVLYKTDNNKTASAAFDLTNIGNANATGNCSLKADKQLLQLSWSNISSSFEFERNSTAEKYSLSSVELTIPVNKDIFPNITKNETATKITFKHHADVFSVPLSHSFTCANLEPLHLNTTTAINSTYTGTLLITQAHVEAFGVTNKTEYSTAMDCATVLTPDIVPIVVGVILAGLVVVVLIAYLIGRQRAQARGYLSM